MVATAVAAGWARSPKMELPRPDWAQALDNESDDEDERRVEPRRE
jgi:hypothetical protein